MRTLIAVLTVALVGCASPDKLNADDRYIAKLEKPCIERGLKYASAEFTHCFKMQRLEQQLIRQQINLHLIEARILSN